MPSLYWQLLSKFTIVWNRSVVVSREVDWKWIALVLTQEVTALQNITGSPQTIARAWASNFKQASSIQVLLYIYNYVLAWKCVSIAKLFSWVARPTTNPPLHNQCQGCYIPLTTHPLTHTQTHPHTVWHNFHILWTRKCLSIIEHGLLTR